MKNNLERSDSVCLSRVTRDPLPVRRASEGAREHDALRERPQPVVTHREAARGPQRRPPVAINRVGKAPNPRVDDVTDVVELRRVATCSRRRARLSLAAAPPERELQQRQEDDDEHEGARARHARARFVPARDGAHPGRPRWRRVTNLRGAGVFPSSRVASLSRRGRARPFTTTRARAPP